MEERITTITKRDFLVAAILVVITFVATVFRMVPAVCGSFHDDAIYVAMARAIAEGHGYNLINLPFALPQTKYPFIYPMILSGIWFVFPNFPQNLVVMQAFSALCGALSLGVVYLYLVRFNYAARMAAFVAVLFCATSASYTHISSLTLPDALFMLVLTVVLWLLELLMLFDASEPPFDGAKRGKSGSLSLAFLIGLGLGLLFEIRVNGIFVLPAVLLICLIRRKSTLYVLLGAALSMAPWLGWVGWHALHKSTGGAAAYYTEYGSYLSSISPWASFKNVLYLMTDTAKGPLEGATLAWSGNWKTLGPLVDILISTYAWLAVMISFVKFKRVLPCVLMVFAALLIVWPWPLTRYIVPLMPYTMAFACESFRSVLGRMKPKELFQGLAALGTLTLLGLNVFMLWFYLWCYGMTGYLYFTPPTTVVAWQSFERTFGWLKSHATKDDVIACTLDTMCFLYSGLPAFRPFVTDPGALCFDTGGPGIGTVADLSHRLEQTHTRYVVSTPMIDFGENGYWPGLIAQYQQQHPDAKVVYTDADPRFFILQLPSQ